MTQLTIDAIAVMNTSQLVICLPSADSAFGPVVNGCRDNFDFTFAFGQYFFSIVPSLILLLAAPFRLRFLSRKQREVNGNTFKFVKLVSDRNVPVR
jgi:hypothetical protein